jgi:predicted HTH transcriptional regulator
MFVVELTTSSQSQKDVSEEDPPKEHTVREEHILQRNSRITRTLLAQELALSPENIKEYLEKLKEKGVINRISGRKTGYWEVRHSSQA